MRYICDQIKWLWAINIQLQDDHVHVSNADSLSSMCSLPEPPEVIFMYVPPKAHSKAQSDWQNRIRVFPFVLFTIDILFTVKPVSLSGSFTLNTSLLLSLPWEVSPCLITMIYGYSKEL